MRELKITNSMKRTQCWLALIFVVITTAQVYSQKSELQKGKVTFFSEAPLENITATTEEVGGIIDISKNQLAFSIKVNTFRFDKSLMQEHFNEKYLESDKYPKATFTGSIKNFRSNQKGEQTVLAVGKLTIHGITKEVSIPGKIEMNNRKEVHINSKFKVRLEDYSIERPKLVWQNLADEVEVSVDFTFSPTNI
jgi:polyisoprenoid-binding protein YceI